MSATAPTGQISTPSLDPSLVAGGSRDPAPFIAALRKRNPVCWIPGLDAWLVTRHDDVRMLFSDARVSADPRAYERYQPPCDERARYWLAALPFRSTPSDPTSPGRRLVSAALTPRAVARLELRIQEVVEEFAAPLRERRDVVDLVGEFTAPVVATVIGRILGIPPKGEDLRRFRALAISATRSINPILSEKQRLKNERACVEMCEYVVQLVRSRRAQPEEDLISDLVGAASGAGVASDDDVTRIVSAVVSAGTGTTSIAAARALRTLLLHPEELALLRRDRELLPSAVQELLRFDSGLIVMPRYVVEDFELRGCSLRKGQLVALSMMGANRDPRVFDEPDVLDFRRDTKNTLSFGHGEHFCIGANIARAELRFLLDAALDFLPPDAPLLEDRIVWSKRGMMSQIRQLPVDCSGR